MKHQLKKLVIGLLLGATVSSMTAFATNTTIQKDVTYRNINIVVDKNEITPTDANGNYVEPFIIDGTTYLPVRAVANALAKDVSWDDTTNTVSLSEMQITNESIVGIYTLENYNPAYVPNFTLTVNADNTGSLTDGLEAEDFTWSINGNTITLVPNDTNSETATMTIDGTRLMSDEESGSLIFLKADENTAAKPQESVPAGTLQKNVTYRDIKIVVDGNEIIPTDANGNPVEPFIIDGTTYLPVRAVANAFGKEVGWDDATNTVYLGVQPVVNTAAVGIYRLTAYGTNEELITENLPQGGFTLNADGTGIYGPDEVPMEINWVQEGNSIILTTPELPTDPLVLEINGNEMIAEQSGTIMIFTKFSEDDLIKAKEAVTMKTVTVDKTDAKKPIVTIEMANGGIIKAELYPDVAPITVENFISLIEKGFYNGLTFHRNIPGFVIQGGCPNGNGTGGPGYTIKGEFSSNGVENNLKHTRGVLSMARAQDPDSAGSQFFIMHADAPHLDGEYAAFGMVIEGMDVVDKIATSGM